MPNAPKTPTRTFRCDDDIWFAVKEKAHAQGMTVTEILIDAMLDFLKK